MKKPVPAHTQRLMARITGMVHHQQRHEVVRLAGLLKQPGELGYNGDAEVPPQKWSAHTRAAIVFVQTSPEGRDVLARLIERWPSAEKLIYRPGRRAKRGRSQSAPAALSGL